MNVGILGCGVIGGGVLKLIDDLNGKNGIKVLKVFDLPTKKDLLKERFSESIDEVCSNPEIDVVVEAMGGDKFPYECITKALKNGKSVVTSNKEVVSKHMEEFYTLAKEKGVYFLCEASVGGGIPIICSLIDSIKANKVDRIYGIINGTTNYILTRMEQDKLSLQDALKQAQSLGFAELNATADLEGLDMVRKICILSSIAYGGYVKYDEIFHYGITNLTDEILNDVKSLGYTLKFVAESKLLEKDVKVSVEPVLLKSDNPLACVNNEFNGIYYDGESNGTLGFYGKGAGRFPTATAMVSDIIRINNKVLPYYFENQNKFNVKNRFDDSKYYVYDGVKGQIIDKMDDVNKYKFIARIF